MKTENILDLDKTHVNLSEEKRAALIEQLFKLVCFLATVLPLILLALLLADTLMRGCARLSFDFLTGLPSRFAHKAGILPGLVGTLSLMALTTLIAIPLGICAAVYLEEYAKDSWLKRFIELNVSNLAGVPSIIYGLLGLELFVRLFNLGPCLLAGALTMALLILPVVITSTRESLKTA
jgi:phosphate transport system permease protein